MDESDIGTKPWMDDALIVYPDVEEYAVYELVDGWYMNHDLGGDFGGAPNPLYFIDLEDYGRSAIGLAGKNYVVQLSNGKVVETEYGW